MPQIAGGFKLVEGHLQHVVGVAGLRRREPQPRREFTRRAEPFVAAITPNGGGVVAVDDVQEISRSPARHGIAGKLELSGRTHQRRDLHVGVPPIEYVGTIGQVQDNFLVIKPLRDSHVPLVAGHGVEVGEDFVHAPVLNIEHIVEEVGVGPQGEIGGEFGLVFPQNQGRLVVGVEVRIAVGRQDFVEHIPVIAHAADAAPGVARLVGLGQFQPAAKYGLITFPKAGPGRGVARREPRIELVGADSQAIDQVRGAVQKAFVARLPIHKRHRREVVPEVIGAGGGGLVRAGVLGGDFR